VKSRFNTSVTSATVTMFQLFMRTGHERNIRFHFLSDFGLQYSVNIFVDSLCLVINLELLIGLTNSVDVKFSKFHESLKPKLSFVGGLLAQ